MLTSVENFELVPKAFLDQKRPSGRWVGPGRVGPPTRPRQPLRRRGAWPAGRSIKAARHAVHVTGRPGMGPVTHVAHQDGHTVARCLVLSSPTSSGSARPSTTSPMRRPRLVASRRATPAPRRPPPAPCRARPHQRRSGHQHDRPRRDPSPQRRQPRNRLGQRPRPVALPSSQRRPRRTIRPHRRTPRLGCVTQAAVTR